MEKVKQVFSLQWDEQRTRGAKSVAVRALAGFLCLMVCCTIVSRAADSLTVALVSTERPQRLALMHTVNADGEIEALGQIPVTVTPNALVREIAVSEGDVVQAGDLLFVYDTDELRKELSGKQLELQRFQLELQAQRETDALALAEEDKNLERAQEDLEIVDDHTSAAVSAAQDELSRARKALNNYTRYYDDDDEYDKDSYDSEYEALRSTYREKRRLYDQAITDREDALREAQRKLDDVNEPSVNVQADLKGLEIQIVQLEMYQIQQELATDGQVYAPADGVVSALVVEVGKRTTSEAAAFLTDGGRLRFVAEISENQQTHVVKGDTATLTLPGNKRVEDLEVTAVNPPSGARTQYQVVVELPEGVGELGLKASMQVRQRTGTYNTVVSLSALYGAAPNHYVLVVRESETSLGVEQTVERIGVTIQESNETHAAVEGALYQDDLVVFSVDRPLSDGDRVRVQGTGL